MPRNQKPTAIAEPDIRDSGTSVRSDATLEGGSRKASSDELAFALESSQRRIAELEAQLAAKPATTDTSSDALYRLADLLTQAVNRPTVQAVPEPDGINRTTDFRNQRATIDGQGLAEAQITLSEFKSEERKPISIPKAMANQVGAALAITVNGVRVSIPCDGKTYYINATHWEHARERLAKLDILAANTEPQIVEIS